jgi:hypothetical protein
MDNFEKLKKPFDDSELEWKPQSVGIKNDKPWAMILCYVQARAIQNRLDDVFGPMNWKDEYRFEKNGVICRLSVYCNDKKEWISKENGSPETDIESFKGGISGAFKRVASSGYGIGRYLYELDTTFAECSMTKQNGYKQAKTKDGRYFYWKVPTSIEILSKKLDEIFAERSMPKQNGYKQTTQQKPREKNEWETKLLEQANGNEDVLIGISESWNNGIKSEKQYHWFSKQLVDRNYK